MIYNLNLTEDYVTHWGLKEAIRELIANNIDEGGKLSYTASTSLDKSDMISQLVFTTDKELPIEAFLLGYSVKSNANSIGQYGEGLKLAMLVLRRLNKTVLFRSGPYVYRFYFAIPEGFGVSTLHLEREEFNIDYEADENDVVVKGTRIVIFDVERSVFEDIYTYAPVDTMMKERVGLFCHGLLVEKGFYVRINDIEYGINLDTAVKGNRDRTYFTDKHLICPVIEKTFKPKDLLEISTSWYVGDIYQNFSPDFKQEIAKAWFLEKNISYNKETLEDKRVLLTSNYGTRYMRRDGYLVAPYFGYANYLNSEADRKILRELEINEDYIAKVDVEGETRKQLVSTILDSCKEAIDIYDLIEILTNYIPAFRSNRDSILANLLEIATKKIKAKYVLKPKTVKAKKVTNVKD